MLRPHRLIITPYLNSRAFVHHGPPGMFRFLPLTPREAVPAILSGKAIAGLVPVGGLAALSFEVDMLGEYGIASPGPAQSVLLRSRVPFAALGSAHSIRLSPDSMSSVRLLYLLLSARAEPTGLPHPASEGTDADAELVIGDLALRHQDVERWPYTADLAGLWTERQRLPMVFARWVIHKRASTAMRAHLMWWLAAYAKREADLRAQTARLDHAMVGRDPAEAAHYLAGLRHVLTPADLAGQARYEEALAANPWLDDLLDDHAVAPPLPLETFTS